MVQPFPDDGDDRHRQNDRRDAPGKISDKCDDIIRHTSVIACKEAKRHTDAYFNEHGQNRDSQCGTRTVYNAGKHIPPELIRRMDNVWKCINTVNEQLSGVTFWNAHKRRDDCIRLLGENLYDVYLLKAHVDEIDSTVSKQEESIKEKDMKIDKLSNHLEETEIALIVAQTKTSQLEEEKDSMLELLEYVPPEKRSRFEHKKSAER